MNVFCRPDPVGPGPSAGAGHESGPRTRAEWEEAADRLLLPVRAHASPRHALVGLPGVASHNGAWSDGLEGFARTFLLAAFRLAGARGDDPHGHAEWYAAGIEAGVDPASEERWPTFAESHQAKVEAASIALALHETRPWIWDRLPERTRAQLLDWLGAMAGTAMPGNNWIWFQAVTEAFARTVGGTWLPADLDRTVELTDAWYARDGWYSDGLSGGAHRNFDHYNGWAMHLYPLWFCRVLGADAPAGLLERYRGRLRRFLDDYRHLVGGNGSPLLQGRSVTYRYAALAPVWTGALFDATPLPPGQTRRLARLVLGHFTAAGDRDGRGLLTLGWHRPYRPVLQGYSGPASPYWASKGFAGLLLPPGHPVWHDAEVPLPVEGGDTARVLEAPGWLVSGTHDDGVVRVVNHGSDHAEPARQHSDDPLYARLAYSTHTAPATPADPAGGPLDSAVVLLDAAGAASHRRPLERIAVQGRVGVSRSRAHWPDDARWDCFGGPATRYRTGPWITVASVLRGAVEVRLVRVDPGPGRAVRDGAYREERDPGPWRLALGGWALPDARPDRDGTGTDGEDGGDGDGTGTHGVGTDGVAAAVVGGGLRSGVLAVWGFDEAGTSVADGASALGGAAVIPWVATRGPVGYGVVYAAVVRLAGTPHRGLLPGVSQLAGGGGALKAAVDWPDGARDEVALPAPPAP
ncbi:DUF2264 domain-containing protein [Streptomyces sp. NPDC050560]|uniref:DUF2264 domain-containing protein n=1 Tax=Streptomyces sp. NPDC050560 TaxID=3365630 RepID=UPI0037BDBF44